MNHKNIAQVFDGGITENGAPYFVMELVDGLPLNEFCQRHQLNIDQRLRLFAEICEGVEHAHQKGIIHRDLKPSNIIVTLEQGTPTPKIIDFGLAKATGTGGLSTDNPLTEMGQMLGTLQYMSPEQAQLGSQDIDTRTDIYSLGVILYELVTGVTPIREETTRDKNLVQVLQLIQQREPTRPSTQLQRTSETPKDDPGNAAPVGNRRRIEGELDWIVMKCLAVDRAMRYAAASQLAEDVNNFLTNQPVIARPPSTYYRVTKLIQRNRGYAMLGSLLLITLIAATGISTLQAARADAARRRSEAATNRALGMVESVQKLVLDSPVWKVNNPGRTALIELLANEYEYWAIDTLGATGELPSIANNLVGLARNEFELGRADKARRMATKAMELVRSGGQTGDPASELVVAAAEILMVGNPGDSPEEITEQVLRIVDRVDRVPLDELQRDLATRRCEVLQSLADVCFRNGISLSFSLALSVLQDCDRLLDRYADAPELQLIKARALSRIGISMRQLKLDPEEVSASGFKSNMPLYNEAIAIAEELIRRDFRPVETSQFLSGVISNRGLQLVAGEAEGTFTREQVLANYDAGLSVCQGLLDQYPDNLTFQEIKGLLLLNLASAHENFQQWEREESLRQQADRLLESVVAEVGPGTRAGERFALNRLHYVVNLYRLGRFEKARQLANELHRLDLVDQLRREYFQKLIFNQVVLEDEHLDESSRVSLRESSEQLFPIVMKAGYLQVDDNWRLLDDTDLFAAYRDNPEWEPLWESVRQQRNARKESQ